MFKTKLLAAATVAFLVATASAGFAQTQPDPHHSDQNQAGATDNAVPLASGMPMMNMRGMMNMMNMMGGQMGMGGAGFCIDAMGMANRVEGHIAFLRAELKITEAQAKPWDAFADALRSNAKRMRDSAGAKMMGGGDKGFLSQLETQEKMLATRLDSVKALRAALAPLSETLSEDQRKTAEELLGPHMGMMGAGMMGTGMMQGGMMQGGMMQGDTTQPQNPQ
jgi:LTXXQ motif family protein